MVHGQHDVTEFLDPKLERNFPTEEAILVLGLAAQCMKQDSNYIPTSELLQIEKQHQEASPSGQEDPPSPLPTTSQVRSHLPNNFSKLNQHFLVITSAHACTTSNLLNL